MKNPVFTGAGVAIITPMYEDGSINFDELGRIVEDQIARGTDAIVICGTTGKCLSSPVPVPMTPTTAVLWLQSLPPAAQTLCCW